MTKPVRMHTASMLALLVAVAACDSPSEPADSVDVELAFGIPRQAIEPPFMLQNTANELIVRGYYETLCSPTSAVARAEVEDRVVTVTITGGASSACHPVIGSLGYQVIIRDVTESYHTVRVVHEWKDTGRAAEEVFEERILTPHSACRVDCGS